MLAHRMLLGTERYLVGSGGCLPHGMLLGTARYQVGSDGCSPHRLLLGIERCLANAVVAGFAAAASPAPGA